LIDRVLFAEKAGIARMLSEVLEQMERKRKAKPVTRPFFSL
jgi:hypothetical protein